MLRQLLVGGGVSVVNIAIPALVMTILVWVARAVSAENKSHPAVFLMAVMISTVSVLMAAHAVEVIVWSLALASAWPPAGTAWAIKYVPLEQCPITALNGVLLIGWSTAVIFE